MASARTLCMQVEALVALALLWPGVGATPLPCDPGCIRTSQLLPTFQHISQLHSRSTSPWELLEEKQVLGQNPAIIKQAHCKNCSEPGELEAKPIFLQVYIDKVSRLQSNVWCHCPYKLAVACTCVPKRKTAAA